MKATELKGKKLNYRLYLDTMKSGRKEDYELAKDFTITAEVIHQEGRVYNIHEEKITESLALRKEAIEELLKTGKTVRTYNDGDQVTVISVA